MHDGVVLVGIKGLAQAIDLLHTQLFQGGVELGHDHLHALAVGLVLGALLQGPLQVVIHRQELLHGVGFDFAVEIVLFLLAAASEVVILGANAQVLVVECGLFLFQDFLLRLQGGPLLVLLLAEAFFLLVFFFLALVLRRFPGLGLLPNFLHGLALGLGCGVHLILFFVHVRHLSP